MSVPIMKPAYLLLSHSTLVFATWKSLFPLLHSISFHLTHRLRCAAMFFPCSVCESQNFFFYDSFFFVYFYTQRPEIYFWNWTSRMMWILDSFFSLLLFSHLRNFSVDFFVCNWRKKCEYYEIIDTHGWGGF